MHIYRALTPKNGTSRTKLVVWRDNVTSVVIVVTMKHVQYFKILAMHSSVSKL